jgi:PAS domain S-box-containing protein
MMERGTVRLLLVEDNPGDARLVEILLSEAGSSADFEVILAERVGEALERLEQSGFDAILLDLSLPDSSGLETVSRIRTAAPQTPMVVLSGQDDEETALQALHMGAQDYLLKGQADNEAMARSIRYAIERARTEEELRRSEERFRMLVQGVRDYAIFMLDPGGRVESWNEAAGHIQGYQADEIIGRHFSVFYTEEDVERGRPEEQLRIAAAEGRCEEEALRRRKDGSRFWAEAVITPSRDEAGELRGFSNVTRDITGRKETEEALRRSLKELADLKFALDESVIIAMADVKGRITYVNDKFCEVSGYSREEFLGEDRRIVDAAYHPERLVDGLWRTIRRGEVWRGEIKHPARDGDYYWLDASIVPSLDERGEPYRYVAICNDITKRKEAEEALRRSLKELADLKFALHDEELIVRDYRIVDADYRPHGESADAPGGMIA